MGSSVELAFRVVAEASRGGRDAASIARVLGVSTSSVEDVLSSLIASGVIERVAGEVRLGATLDSLAHELLEVDARVSVAEPILSEIAVELGVAAAFAIADGDGVRGVLHADPSGPGRVIRMVSDASPLHASAAGLVLLALREPDAIDSYLDREAARAIPGTTGVDVAAVRDSLSRVREQGWIALDDLSPGAMSAATPIGGEGLAPAALVVTGPSDRVPPAGGETGFGAALLAAARRIGELPPVR